MTIRVHNFFRTGPFSKSATPEVKSFASSSAVHRTPPLLLNGFSASENPLYPEPIRTEQGRQKGRTEYLFTRMEGGREGGGSRCTGSRYGIEWRLQGLARMEEFLLPSSVVARARRNCARSDSKFDFYLGQPATQTRTLARAFIG